MTYYILYIIIYIEIRKGSYEVTQRWTEMRIKEQLIKEVNDMVLENRLQKDKSFEIVAYGDINRIDIDFETIGSSAMQKDSIFWEQFDEKFNVESFVDKVLALL